MMNTKAAPQLFRRSFASTGAALLLAVPWASAQSTTIFTEGFENSFPGTWNVGDSNTVAPDHTWASVAGAFGGHGAASGGKMGYCAGSKYVPNSIQANPQYSNNSTAFMERGLDLSNHSAATLKFMLKIPSIEKNYDFFRVLIDEAVVYSTDDPINTWTLKTFDLTPHLGAIRTLRFEFVSDAGNVREGVYLDEIEVTATPRSEVTVFGIGERGDLSNSASTGTIKIDRPSISDSQFNYESRKTRSVGIVKAGTLIIDADPANDPDAVYSQFNNQSNIKEMEIIAETLIIRSPIHLKGTNLKIYARDLRFEGTGKITTTPDIKTIPAADASATAPGANGVNGLPGGDVELYVSSYTNATGDPGSRFDLSGGPGQAAGKGKHGENGTSLQDYKPQHTYMLACFANDQLIPTPYTAPPNTFITSVVHRDNDTQRFYGVASLPTNGKDAWRSGTPGQGGNSGKMIANIGAISGIQSNGAPGASGIPAHASGKQSSTVCWGGNAGLPTRSIQITLYPRLFVCDVVWAASSVHSTTAGASYPVPTAALNTTLPTRTITNDPFDWIHPLLVRKAIADAKDHYLQNRIQEATRILSDYNGRLSLFRSHASWATSGFDLELGQLHDECRILLQQIGSGLDYFGNPGGWVPMLSYEINAKLFDQEIDRSLDIIYLSQWIAGKQDNAVAVRAAFTTARNKLAGEITAAQDRFDAARTSLSNLEGEAQDITEKTNQLLSELEAKDTALSITAEVNARPPAWEVALRLTLKVAGTVCKMIPVYQPALGSIGDVANLGSNFDPDKPWATVRGGLDIASSGLNTQVALNASAQASLVSKSKLNPDQLKEFSAIGARNTQLKEMSAASTALSGGIGNITEYIELTKAPVEKINAELEKLRSADPAYGEIVDRIKAVTEQRRDYADRISAAAFEIATLYDTITRGLLAMDAFSDQIATSSNIINPKVNSYLKDMERRAFDRLLKYHYYMAKAYEYRLVKPYTGTLNLQSLYNTISTIASAPAGTAQDGSITDGQRNLLKSAYRAVIAQATEDIVTQYNNSPSTPGGSRSYSLTPSQIAILNKGDVLKLNLYELPGLFQPEEENVRIVNLEVVRTIGASAAPGMTTTPRSGGSYNSSSAYVELLMEHSGVSNIKLNGDVFQFRHYNESTRNAITWINQYEPNLDIISPTPPQEAADSLLRSLIANAANAILYSRPSAWADLSIWRRGANGAELFGLGNDNPPILITGVTLRVTYDRISRTSNPNVRDISVVSQATDGTPISPKFSVNRADRNGRQDGEGRFLRIYPSSSTPVIITAPAIYGTLKFVRWVNSSGVQQTTSPTISLVPTSDQKVFAIYESGTPAITSTLALSGQTEVSFIYTLTGDKNPTGFVVSDLPAGLRFSSTTGIISGIPRVAGTFNVAVSAANEYGPGVPSTLVMTLSGPDSFASAITLSGMSPSHSGSHPAPNARWFRWTAPFSGNLTVDTFGSSFDTTLELFEGDAPVNLAFLTENDDANGTLQSKVAFPVREGVTYRIALDSHATATGNYVINLALTSSADYLIVADAGIIFIADQTHTGTPLTVDQAGAGTIRFAAPGRTFSINYGPLVAETSGGVSLAGITQIIVDGGSGDDNIIIGPFHDGLPSLTVQGGTGDDHIEIRGAIFFLPDASLDIDLQNDAPAPGIDRITVRPLSRAVVSGVGTITLRCSRNIVMNSGARLDSTTGTITVEANQQAIPTPGNFSGLRMDNAIIKATTGLVTVRARGGNDPSGSQLGIDAVNAAQILSDRHTIINGSGGGSNGWVNRGVTLVGQNTRFQSGGILDVNGIGGPNGAAYGIGITLLAGAQFVANELYVTGAGQGAPGSPENYGIEMGGSGTMMIGGAGGCRLKGSTDGAAPGIILADSASVHGQGINLNTDNLIITGNALVVGVSSVGINPIAATLVNFGGASSLGTLGVTNAMLGRIITPALLTAAPAAEVIVTAPIIRSAQTNLFVFAPRGFSTPAAGTNINLAGGFLTLMGTKVKFPVTGAGRPTIRLNGNVQMIDIGFDRSALDLAGTTHPGSVGESITVLENLGNLPVGGLRFADLPEGAVMPWPGSPLLEARISYMGGDGNDITLTLQTASGYPRWAAINIPPGKDNSFEGDANGDGVPNGLNYVFGTIPPILIGPGLLIAPGSIPPDVDLYLERSTTLAAGSWLAGASWVNGLPPVFAPGFEIVGASVFDGDFSPAAFYRYRAVRR